MSVSRETLYAEVWAEPMTKVAPRYGVSSNFLARVCARLKVPCPPRGYWAKREVGKASERPALPEPEPGDELEWNREGEPRRAPLPNTAALPTTPPAVTAGKRPSRHPLLSEVKELFEAAPVLDDGYLKPSKRYLVDVCVTREILKRALDTANALYLALQDRGHRVMFAPHSGGYRRPELDEREPPAGPRWGRARWRPDRPTLVFVGAVAFGLTLFEPSEEVEVEWIGSKKVRVRPPPAGRRPVPRGYVSRSYMPSGRLSLLAYCPYATVTWQRLWKEDDSGKLSERGVEIATGLEEAAPTIVKLLEEARRKAEIERQQWEEQRRRWAREEEERRRAQALKESREELLRMVDAWVLARQLEAFFSDAERRVTTLESEDQAVVVERLRRARELFGGVDALERLRAWRSPEER